MRARVVLSLLLIMIVSTPVEAFVIGGRLPRGLPLRAGSTVTSGSSDVPRLSYPKLGFPANQTSVFTRANPKKSLGIPPSAGWRAMLLAVEAVHWATFPIGINIMLYIFQHAATIGAALPSGPGEPAVRVFLLLLCLVAQLFGGLPGIMMHEYEGWQISPFANPLALPASPTGAEVDEVRPQEYNNAWLRAVAYRLLFALQGFGLNCFTVGVFGMHTWALALFWATVAIALFNPRVPFVALQSWKESRPYLPLPAPLLVIFIVSAIVNFTAYLELFGPWGAVPPLLIMAGGMIEGVVAEVYYSQPWHIFAVVCMGLGLHLHLPLFKILVESHGM